MTNEQKRMIINCFANELENIACPVRVFDTGRKVLGDFVNGSDAAALLRKSHLEWWQMTELPSYGLIPDATVKKGFLYRQETGERIPYWVTETQAVKIAEFHGGTPESFFMAWKRAGIMIPVLWEFRETLETADRNQWLTDYYFGDVPTCNRIQFQFPQAQ